MDFDDSPDDASFRAELRGFLDAHARPRNPAQLATGFGAIVAAQGTDDPEPVARARAWQRTLAEGGWGAPAWPREHGGRDATATQAFIVAEETARYDVPAGDLYTIGLGIIGPTLVACGSPDQHRRFLPRMLDGSEVWCQLWSEPDAGSDVASLETRAERDGDGWTLHGQKVWTTGAQHCRWGLAIARTDPDVPKHRGITCFVVDMLDPGVTVRPLRQMTGGAHFNEVFLDGARVPDEHVVGEVGGGWHVAMATLANERYSVGGLLTTGFSAEPVLALAGGWAGGRPARDPVLRQELARIYTAWRLLALTNARSLSALARGSVPGPEGSTIKLAWARLSTALADVAVRVLGPAAGIVGEDAPEPGHWTTALLYAPANHIAGGTDEIQKTIIGERVLGLPREPAVDRDVPFRELKAASARR